MRRSSFIGLSLLAFVAACSSSKSAGNAVGGGGNAESGGSGGTTASAGNAGTTNASGGVATGGRGGAQGSGGVVSNGGGGAASASIEMPLISKNVPAFASTGPDAFRGPDKADDTNNSTQWGPTTMPAWIAYDLSGVPAAKRDRIVVAWYAAHASDYIAASLQAYQQMPVDYTVEINTAPGGAAPPASGWQQVASVTNNDRSSVEHVVKLGGGNWIRMNITKSSDPAGSLAIDLDVYAAPNGASDAWLFMGDSITHITMPYAFSNLPSLVNQAASTRWPAAIEAAIGGTSTATATSIIDATMTGFPGRYVVLAYGTNDHANDFHMEELVKSVLAVGKIPVVPHIPWSDTANIQTNGPLMNAAIDALYVKYPQILRGPDLWAAFLNRTDLIPSGDVHPNDAGRIELRKQWATVMAAVK